MVLRRWYGTNPHLVLRCTNQFPENDNFRSYHYNFDIELTYIRGCLKKKKSKLLNFKIRELIIFFWTIKWSENYSHFQVCVMASISSKMVMRRTRKCFLTWLPMYKQSSEDAPHNWCSFLEGQLKTPSAIACSWRKWSSTRARTWRCRQGLVAQW